jgi:AcrR family transcriptional regulator
MRTRRTKIPDSAVFDAIVRAMMRTGPNELTLAVIAKEAGLTAGALVQRFGSKREMMLAHARYAATTGNIGLIQRRQAGSALRAIRGTVGTFAQLATSPQAALRNLAYLQRDLADPALYWNLLKMNRSARAHYEQLVSDAVAARELQPDTVIAALARTIEATLIGSFLTWTIYREGSAASWIRRDLNAVLLPHLASNPRESRHTAAPK